MKSYFSISKIWDYGFLFGIGVGLNSDKKSWGGRKYPCVIIITIGQFGIFIGPHYKN